MPLYNGAEFLQDSVTSILNQSYQDWELLIGVNGLDESEYEKILDQIINFNDKRIKTFFYSVKSKTATLNTLCGESQYNYLCFIDVDDYWLPEKLTKQLMYIDQYDVVGSDCAYFGERVGSPNIFLGKLNSKMFFYQNPIINSAVMIKKRDAWWDLNWEGLDDYNLWIHLLNKKKTFYNISEILINHRIHKDSYFNHNNDNIKSKLLENNLMLLTQEDYEMLGKIMDDKSWEL